MPDNLFYSFVLSVIRFLQSIFTGITRLLTPLYRLSPLPNSIDFILLVLVIVGVVYLIFRNVPWEK